MANLHTKIMKIMENKNENKEEDAIVKKNVNSLKKFNPEKYL
jgi:hypothetical protein